MFETDETESQGWTKITTTHSENTLATSEGIPSKPPEAAASGLPLQRKQPISIHKKPADNPGTAHLLIHRFHWTRRYFWDNNPWPTRPKGPHGTTPTWFESSRYIGRGADVCPWHVWRAIFCVPITGQHLIAAKEVLQILVAAPPSIQAQNDGFTWWLTESWSGYIIINPDTTTKAKMNEETCRNWNFALLG